MDHDHTNPQPAPHERSSWQQDAITAVHSEAVGQSSPAPAVVEARPEPAAEQWQPLASTPPVDTAAVPPYEPPEPVPISHVPDSSPQQPWQPGPTGQYDAGPVAPDYAYQQPDEDPTTPLAVVQVVSPRGVEYAMMTITLWLGAFSLLGALLSLINGGTSFAVLAVPVSVLIVCLPVFSYFFLRLKKAELLQPQLKLDPSKRRFTQFTQLTSFAACLFTVIAFVYFIMAKISGDGGISFFKALLDVAVVLAVAGGILYYYWQDEHRRGNRNHRRRR